MKWFLVKCIKEDSSLNIKKGQVFCACINEGDTITVKLPSNKRVHMTWNIFCELFALTHG